MSSDRRPKKLPLLFLCLMTGLGIGALAGLAFGLLVVLSSFTAHPRVPMSFTMVTMALFGLAGMVLGLVFRFCLWLVCRR